MTRFARTLVALVVAGAVLAPVATRHAPRGVLPPPAASHPPAPAWHVAMSTIEHERAPDVRSSCNHGRARWTRSEIVCAIRRTFPAAPSYATCIAWHESRLQPHAVGRAGERGLFQLHPVHRAWLGPRWERMFDPVVNARAARDLTRTRDADGRPLGWRPWSTSALC